ncbi:MAG: hypothetical protein HC853_05915 [Anaerolineae bacterium]|nr:hypothetical protein [Anaerolineae bacterium]
MEEIYISTDVETDGPIPGPHSMLSFGSAAFRADKTLLSTFSAYLETLPGATGHRDTMAWCQTQPDAWESTKPNMPKRWLDAGLPHTHTALDDAIEQGALFCNMLVELRQQ